MEYIKKYIMIDCYAFTAICLINALFSTIGLVDSVLPITYCLWMFLMSTVVSVLMGITDHFFEEGGMGRLFVRLLDVLVPVLLFNMFQKDFTIKLEEIVVNIVVCLVIYAVVYSMMYLSWREKDAQINEGIQRMREKRKK